MSLPEGVSWHPGIRSWRADYQGKYIGSRFTVEGAAQLYRDRLVLEKPEK